MNKEIQLEIINKYNPMMDDYHFGIRSVKDIKTFEEAMQDEESFVYGDFDFEDAEKALAKGKITVYSSKPIEQGNFVSTSYNMAKDYAGLSGKVYKKTVSLEDVAWLNGDEGQYANIKEFEGIETSYDTIIADFAKEAYTNYGIVPERIDDFEETLSDFELVKEREDECRSFCMKPYDFIIMHLEQHHVDDIYRAFNYKMNPSRLEQFITALAVKIYEMCRADIAFADKFDKELHGVLEKYFEKYKLEALGEMYDKCDLYDKVGRDDFVDVRAKKWENILKNDKKEIIHDVVLTGIYDENSPKNKEVVEGLLLPEIAKTIAKFERDDLEGGLKKNDIRYSHPQTPDDYDER